MLASLLFVIVTAGPMGRAAASISGCGLGLCRPGVADMMRQLSAEHGPLHCIESLLKLHR